MAKRANLVTGLLGAFALAVSMGPGVDQASAQGAPAGDGKNLKVLPANSTKKDIAKVMKEWNQALGVKCVACHKNLKQPELDDTDLKKISQDMVKLMAEVNKVMQPSLKNGPMTCYSCHKGAQKVPNQPEGAGGDAEGN